MSTGDESEGLDAFSIDEVTGIVRTKVMLDHEQRTFYRMSVSARDQGRPPKETIRQLQIEVLDLNDNRPTFSTSSLTFKVRVSLFSGFFLSLFLSHRRTRWFTAFTDDVARRIPKRRVECNFANSFTLSPEPTSRFFLARSFMNESFPCSIRGFLDYLVLLTFAWSQRFRWFYFVVFVAMAKIAGAGRNGSWTGNRNSDRRGP